MRYVRQLSSQILSTVLGLASGGVGGCTAAPDVGAACDDLCNGPGERRCGPGGYQECGFVDDDSCFEWSPTVACPADERCVDGECVPKAEQVDAGSGCADAGGGCAAACVDDCVFGAWQCVVGGYQVCGRHDEDPCLDWSDPLPCEAGSPCAVWLCSSACVDECIPGTVRCAATDAGLQTCEDTDGDGCHEWGRTLLCAGGEHCDGSACVADPCACDYTPAVCEPNTPDSTSACRCDPDCIGAVPCGLDGHCDTWCPEAVDPDCGQACGCDYTLWVCEPGQPNSTSVCRCDPDCTGDVACGFDGYCDSWCPEGVDPDCDCGCGCTGPC